MMPLHKVIASSRGEIVGFKPVHIPHDRVAVDT